MAMLRSGQFKIGLPNEVIFFFFYEMGNVESKYQENEDQHSPQICKEGNFLNPYTFE